MKRIALHRLAVILLGLSTGAACRPSAKLPGPEPAPAIVAPATVPPLNASAREGTRVLVFSRDTPFGLVGREPIIRPDTSRPTRLAAVAAVAQRHGFTAEHSAEDSIFTDASLARYSAIVFLNTSPTVLSSARKAALQRFVQNGGGFVGVDILSGIEQEETWAWFRDLAGARFGGRAPGPLVIERVDSTHLSTRAVPREWHHRDAWSDHGSFSPTVTVLLRLAERSNPAARRSNPQNYRPPYPVSWLHNYDGGRVWMTSLGWGNGSFADPALLNHIAGGILWATGH